MTHDEFVAGTTLSDVTMLLFAATSALEAGVPAADVASRMRCALNGYNHVSYNAEALLSDIEDYKA